MIDAARRLVPRLIERSASADSERRLPAETIADMQAAGLFRALQPKRWAASNSICEPSTTF